MELLLISSYAAICVAVFAMLRIPLNKWTVPSASIGGIVMILALVQMLNYYHPYSGTGRPHLSPAQITPYGAEPIAEASRSAEKHDLVAWFPQNSLLRLDEGSTAEVTFAGIPGEVFEGRVEKLQSMPAETHAGAKANVFDTPVATGRSRIPVIINITDPRFASYASSLPAGSHAQAAVYGGRFHQLALVRKTLLRMSAWMNFLSFSS